MSFQEQVNGIKPKNEQPSYITQRNGRVFIDMVARDAKRDANELRRKQEEKEADKVSSDDDEDFDLDSIVISPQVQEQARVASIDFLTRLGVGPRRLGLFNRYLHQQNNTGS